MLKLRMRAFKMMLAAMLGCGVLPALAQRGGVAPVVKGGAATYFTLQDLLGVNVGKLVASRQYQISLVLPAKVQSVGVNALKQNALMATIDQFDKRVIYLDVLQSGGVATLNVRTLMEGRQDPMILKFYVELADKASGVLTYAVQQRPEAPQRPASPDPPRRPVQATVRMVDTPPFPTPQVLATVPAPRAAVAPPRTPSAPVKPGQAAVVPKPRAASVIAPSLSSVASVSVPGVSGSPPRPAQLATPPGPGAANRFEGGSGGMRVEAVLDRTSDSGNVIVNYTISTLKRSPGQFLMLTDQVNLHVGNERAVLVEGDHRTIRALVEGRPISGQLLIERALFTAKAPKVLTFRLQDQVRAGHTQYLGVVLR